VLMLQATEAIRGGDGPNRETPIIAVTANAMKGDIDKVHRPHEFHSPCSCLNSPLSCSLVFFWCLGSRKNGHTCRHEIKCAHEISVRRNLVNCLELSLWCAQLACTLVNGVNVAICYEHTVHTVHRCERRKQLMSVLKSLLPSVVRLLHRLRYNAKFFLSELLTRGCLASAWLLGWTTISPSPWTGGCSMLPSQSGLATRTSLHVRPLMASALRLCQLIVRAGR
jgi:hypothetical protein